MWYSVTPENIARSIAERFRDAGCKVVVDACCGSGGNAIQFALCCEKVIAVEINKERVFIFDIFPHYIEQEIFCCFVLSFVVASIVGNSD